MKTVDKQVARGPGRPRDEEVRARILLSAARLLEDVGFNNVTIEAIAEHAGASRATIYRWWPTKASVLIEAFREAVASELPFPDTGSLDEDVRLQLLGFAAMLTGSRGRIFAAFLAGAQTEPEVADAFRKAWIAPRRAEAKKVLIRHQTSGVLSPDMDLDIAIEMMYAPLYYRLLTGYGSLTKPYVEKLARSVLTGFKT
jgi:AcrR family transcriptional regulator